MPDFSMNKLYFRLRSEHAGFSFLFFGSVSLGFCRFGLLGFFIAFLRCFLIFLLVNACNLNLVLAEEHTCHHSGFDIGHLEGHFPIRIGEGLGLYIEFNGFIQAEFN